jgi:hypothetical protein
MTAIGAMPVGVDEVEVARRVAAIDADTVHLYAADVRQWIVGPYTAGTPLDELRVRAAVVLDVAAGGWASRVPGAVAIEQPDSSAGYTCPGCGTDALGPGQGVCQDCAPAEPGSVNDPAYSSPTPVAGPSGLEGPTTTVERESPAGTRVPAEVHDERERTADERDPASGSWDDEDGASATAIADRAAADEATRQEAADHGFDGGDADVETR